MIVKEKISYTRRRVKRPTKTKSIAFRAFPEQADRWFKAAEKAEMSFSAWIAKVLDAAALPGPPHGLNRDGEPM